MLGSDESCARVLLTSEHRHLDSQGVNKYSNEVNRGLNFVFRHATASLRTLPHYIIIGAGKGGTTSLYRYLIQHPLIRAGLTKEVHYFDHNYHKGVRWYRAHFFVDFGPYVSRVVCWPARFACEATPYYLNHPHCPRRIWQTQPTAKLILLLRNPVARAYSQYQMVREKYKYENLSFEEALAAEPYRIAGEYERMVEDEHYFSFAHFNYSYVDRGIYHKYLENWLRWFPREHIACFRSEDLFNDPQAFYDRLMCFLKLPKHTLRNVSAFNVRNYPSLPAALAERLQAFFEPHNEKLFNMLGQRFDWDDLSVKLG